MTEPIDGHDHEGPWAVFSVAIFLLVVSVVTLAMVQNYRVDIIYERVGEMQRQLECPPDELIVTDRDGVEYCLDPAE